MLTRHFSSYSRFRLFLYEMPNNVTREEPEPQLSIDQYRSKSSDSLYKVELRVSRTRAWTAEQVAYWNGLLSRSDYLEPFLNTNHHAIFRKKCKAEDRNKDVR